MSHNKAKLNHAAPEVGYVLKAFGRTSETFITNEIYLLEQLGMRLAIFSIKQLESQRQHGVISRIKAPLILKEVRQLFVHRYSGDGRTMGGQLAMKSFLRLKISVGALCRRAETSGDRAVILLKGHISERGNISVPEACQG